MLKSGPRSCRIFGGWSIKFGMGGLKRRGVRRKSGHYTARSPGLSVAHAHRQKPTRYRGASRGKSRPRPPMSWETCALCTRWAGSSHHTCVCVRRTAAGMRADTPRPFPHISSQLHISSQCRLSTLSGISPQGSRNSGAPPTARLRADRALPARSSARPAARRLARDRATTKSSRGRALLGPNV